MGGEGTDPSSLAGNDGVHEMLGFQCSKEKVLGQPRLVSMKTEAKAR